MSDCEYCGENLRELKREQKRTTVLSNALIQIYGVAKDNMWYPSSFKERGEDGFASHKAFVDADLAALKHDGYTK